jgi:hypothetical protein
MIHPKQIFGDLKKLWKDYLAKTETSEWVSLKNCTACEGEEIGPFFSIWGYRYDRCRTCSSIFLNPQPRKSLYEAAFFNSPISEFVKSDNVQEQYLARFKKTIHPLLSEIINDSASDRLHILEVFGRNRHIVDYLNSQQKVEKYLRFQAGIEDKSGRSISVTHLSDIKDSSCDLILLLMSVEQMRKPAKILSELSKKLSEDGRMIILARLGSGIDIQLLRGNNSSIFPLEHIHLFSVEGYENICERVGLEIHELSTPGLLDTEYLKQYYQMHPEENDIFQYLFKHRSSLDIRRFQQFIQEVRLSSALRLTCKRKI